MSWKTHVLGILAILSIPLIMIALTSFQCYESDLRIKAWINYVDDPVFTSNATFATGSEVASRIVYRGFIPFTSPEVHSYIVGQKDGRECYFTVVTNMDTMKYQILEG